MWGECDIILSTALSLSLSVLPVWTLIGNSDSGQFYFLVHYRWWLFRELVHCLLLLLRMWGKNQAPFLVNAVVKLIAASPRANTGQEPLIMGEPLIMWELVSGHNWTSKVFNTVITLVTYQFSYVWMPILKIKSWTDSDVWTLIGNSDSGLGWRKIYVCCLAHHLFMLSFWPNDFGRRMTDFHPSFMDFLWKKTNFLFFSLFYLLYPIRNVIHTTLLMFYHKIYRDFLCITWNSVICMWLLCGFT